MFNTNIVAEYAYIAKSYPISMDRSVFFPHHQKVLLYVSRFRTKFSELMKKALFKQRRAGIYIHMSESLTVSTVQILSTLDWNTQRCELDRNHTINS